MRFQPKAVLCIAGIVACFLAGCSWLGSSKTPLEQILANFKDGKQDESVQKFIDSDWHLSPAFGKNSPMNAREADFASLSEEKRNQLLKDVLKDIQLIRFLAKAVSDKSNSVVKSDPKQAQKGKTMLKELGKKMDQPEGLKIIQLIGQAVGKLGN